MQTPKGKITIGELSQECVDDLASLGDIKIDKTQIKNNLTETETGNVLDAVQGKLLDDKLSTLSQYRGVLIGNANSLTTTGWWKVEISATNVPVNYGKIEIKRVYGTETYNKYIEQTFTAVAVGEEKQYFRVSIDDGVTWSTWKQITTTDELSVLLDIKVTDKTSVLLLPKGYWRGENLANAPTVGWYIYNVKYLTSNYVYIEASGYSTNKDKKYFSLIEAGVFGGWKQLAITDNTYSLSTRNRHIYNTPAVNNNSYSEGAIEITTNNNSAPILGFHRQGVSAVALYELGGRLRMKSNDGSDALIATTDKVEITPLNGWVNETFTTSKLSKDGNLVTLNAYLKSGVVIAYTQLYLIPAEFRPFSNLRHLSATIISGGVTTSTVLRLQSNGILDLNYAIPTGSAIVISSSYTIT